MVKMSEKVPHRRRREKKTDFKQRLKLLKSGKPRLVIRKSSNNMITQLVERSEDGDETLVEAEARELEDFGWKGHKGNISAAYLTGYLIGKRTLKEGFSEAVADIGLQESTRGNRIYASIKGTRDSGVEVPAGEELLPSEERVKGKHIENYASDMNKNERKKRFSKLIERGIDPEKVSKNFEKVKNKIDKELGE